MQFDLNAYLIVDDDMDRTMCGVRGEFAEVEGLVYNSLSSEGSVSVDQNGHDL